MIIEACRHQSLEPWIRPMETTPSENADAFPRPASLDLLTGEDTRDHAEYQQLYAADPWRKMSIFIHRLYVYDGIVRHFNLNLFNTQGHWVISA